MLAQLQQKHPNDVRIIYRYFPLPGHQLSVPAAEAAEAAGKQGKFWEMHDKIFAEQSNWVAMTPDQFQSWAADQAAAMGLNKDQFVKDMTSKPVSDKVLAAQKHGQDVGIPGTPFLLANGKIFPDALPRTLESFESILGLSQLEARQYTYCPPMKVDAKKQYTAIFKTSKGDFTMQLFPDKAPMTVNSFVFLARNGWFNNVPFHRVLADFVAQTGDPSGSGLGGPGYYFKDEISDLKYDKEGMVGMANSGPNTNGSQFFITYKALPDLDGKYTIFGQVVQGMDVVKKLTPRDPSAGGDLPAPDMILSVEIQEK